MRGFLNEIKNVAINRATNKLNNLISVAWGGGRTTNPGARGGIDRSQYATLKPFKGKHISYPEDLGSNDQGHYIVFHINEQANANVKFSQGRNLKKASKYSGNEFDDFHQPEKTSISVPKAATKRLEASIAMYMPATVNVSQASQYGEVEIGVLATAAANAIKQGKSEGFFNKEFAKKAFDEANLDLAKGKLTKIIRTVDNSNTPLHDIAVIRLGYILIQERNFDEAKKNLAPRLDFYEPKRLELLGDIASFEESYEAANTYYEEAIKATGDQVFIELMNIKLSLLPSS